MAPWAVIPYMRAGPAALAEAIWGAAVAYHCTLVRAHGMTTLGSNLGEAVGRAEELEEMARHYFSLKAGRQRTLTTAEIQGLERTFPNCLTSPGKL